jgi:spore coat protein U-like protein
LKKLMLIAAMLALVLVVAAPAIAQVTNAVGQESESGDVSLNFSANQSGNSSNQCVTPLQFGNTGSLQNGQAALQYGSDSGDIEFEGSTFDFSPTLTANCSQAVQQSAAASSN